MEDRSSIQFSGVTFTGSDQYDEDLLFRLPKPLRGLLKQLNGFILHQGGLHVRGACDEPEWHSLRRVWTGPSALHELYNVVFAEDIPFGQDCVGDQFLLREENVVRLLAETGELEELNLGLHDFLRRATKDPDETLGMSPLKQFENSGERLQPGQLLHVYPPFCTKESASGVSLRPVSALELIGWHADFAQQISSLGDGESFQIEIGD